MVRVDVQMVSISPLHALDLVPRLRDPRTIEAAVAKLQSMIAKKEATLLAWPVVWTPGGQMGTAETAEEKRYPTEPGAPAGIPQGFVMPPRLFSLPPWSNLLRGGVPVAIETRRTGPMIEVEPAVADDGRSIELNAMLQYVRCAGFARFVDGKFPGAIGNHIERAEFVVTRTVSPFLVATGRAVLAGCFYFQGKVPHVELFILRATTRRTASP